MSDDRFDEFWAIYPRKVAKAKARRVWARQIKAGHKPEIMIAGIKRLLREYMYRMPDFRPHAASWLNDERWEDVPSLEQYAAEHAPKQNNQRIEAGKRALERHRANEPKNNTAAMMDFINEGLSDVEPRKPFSELVEAEIEGTEGKCTRPTGQMVDNIFEQSRPVKAQPSRIQLIVRERIAEEKKASPDG